MAPTVWVITGTSRGIGLEFVRQLSQEPNTVVFAVARNLAKATALNALASPTIIPIEADTTKQADIDAAVAEIKKRTDYVDILLNNAAVSLTSGDHLSLFSSVPPEQFLQSFDLNVVGVIRTTNAFLPLLKAGKEKKIIMTGSTAGSIERVVNGWVPAPGSKGWRVGSYATAKSALNMVTAKYAAELKDEGFICFTCQPGWVKTDMGGHDRGIYTVDQSVSKQREVISKLTPYDNGRFGGVDGYVEF